LSHKLSSTHWLTGPFNWAKGNPLILKGTYELSQKTYINKDSTAIF